MLQQFHRFHGHGSLRYVYTKGRAVRSSQFTMKYCTNPHRKSARFAVVVSKKKLKLAVKRNYVRRRIYEIIRYELPRLKESIDVAIIIINPEIYSMTHGELKQLVKRSFSDAGLYK